VPALTHLLDTNTVADLVRNPAGAVARNIERVGFDAIAISVIVACEIRFGLERSGSLRLRRALEPILDALTVEQLKPPVDVHYTRIRQELERAGTPIGPNDLLLAAHACALDVTFVTDNAREFRRVKGLRVEDWLRT
jgi:tRNA(fMet)-specific endonuclease VapC